MNYNDFRTAWDAGLREAGLLRYQDRPEETIILNSMDRQYRVLLGMVQTSEPVRASMELFWTWDALQSARTQTTEEDVLTELLGRKGAQDINTERPWMRVDLKLQGKFDWDKPLLMPSTEVWRAWVSEIMAPMEELLPAEGKRRRGGAISVLAWRGKPEAQVQVGPQGEIWLLGVELVAWEAVHPARKWDDTQRKPDEGPQGPLVEMVGRWRDALEIWRKGLKMLLPLVTSVN